jgi:AraC-like DNA-binding protein
VTYLIRAASLHGYEELATELGLDVARQARLAGLTLKALRDPHALIPYRNLMLLLERGAREAQCPDFGMRLSQRQGLDILGPLAVLMAHAHSVMAAMQDASRYLFVHSPAIRFDVRPAGDKAGQTDLRFEILVPNAPGQAQTLELSLGVVVRVLAMLSRGQIRQVQVLLPHAAVAAEAVYSQTLGCQVRFEQPFAAVRVSTAALAKPLPSHNPLMGELARSYLDTQLARPDRTLSRRVASLLREFLGVHCASREDIAQMLAMHPRTLQRRLSDEGTSFEEVKDQVRREMLEQMLQRAEVPSLTQIAGMLDYGAQSALTRSCRRWFDMTPSALIKRDVPVGEPTDEPAGRKLRAPARQA